MHPRYTSTIGCKVLAALASLALAGCASMVRMPALAPPPASAVPEAAQAAPPSPQPATREKAAPAPQAEAAPPSPAIAPAKPAPAAAVAKPASPTSLAAAKPAAAPPLDIKSLEQRLRETDAIGVMTKLSLKNQVDDLIDQFRDYHAGRLHATLAELRRPFDLLLMKVLALLQDADPPLAKAIHDSRDAIWAILSNRDLFSKLA